MTKVKESICIKSQNKKTSKQVLLTNARQYPGKHKIRKVLMRKSLYQADDVRESETKRLFSDCNMAGGAVIMKSVVFLVLIFSVCIESLGARAMINNAGPITGGISEIPKDDPQVTRLAKLVADKLTEGDNKERTVVEVVRAGVQVVSGTLTHLVLKISDGEQARLYEANIWEQPWLNKTEITKLEPLDDN